MLFHKLRQLGGVFNEVIAVGSSDIESFWQGEHFLTSRDLKNHLATIVPGRSLIFGLDAPLLSVATIDEFIASSLNSQADNDNLCCTTFRETPLKKNPASLEIGGHFVCTAACSQERLDISLGAFLRACYEDGVSAVENISVDFKKNELRIRSGKPLHIDFSYADRKKQEILQQPFSSQEKNIAKIKIVEGCDISVSEPLVEPQLYSKIHYTLPPLTIEGLIGVNAEKTRINLQTGNEIHGRQEFPEIYEPFLGMIYADKTEILEIICSERWFAKQTKLMPFFVHAQEAKLISDDALFIASVFSRESQQQVFNGI